MTDGAGAITDTYTYDAFGNLFGKTGATVNNYLYNGEQFDANTGFYYLRARYMNPSTGTFISMDPAQGSIFDPVSLHKYLYANANPVMNCDPSGRFTMLEMGLTMAISGVITGFINLLYYDSHGGDHGATSTRLGIFFGGFFQGALMSGGLLGLALIGTVLASALLGVILTGLGIKGISDAADRFQAGDNVWGWIFLASSFLCFFGALSSFRQAIAINDINTYNDMLANANAQSGSGLPGGGGSTSGPKTVPQLKTQEGNTPVIGKMNDLNAPGNILKTEFKVADYLPDMGSPKLNWKQNDGLLRSVMNERVPIKDVSAFPMENAGFLGAERNLLQNREWTYTDGYWYPPAF